LSVDCANSGLPPPRANAASKARLIVVLRMITSRSSDGCFRSRGIPRSGNGCAVGALDTKHSTHALRSRLFLRSGTELDVRLFAKGVTIASGRVLGGVYLLRPAVRRLPIVGARDLHLQHRNVLVVGPAREPGLELRPPELARPGAIAQHASGAGHRDIAAA